MDKEEEFKDREVKSVSFNMKDPIERKLFMHQRKYPNFSVYIKRLIQKDAEQGFFSSPTPIKKKKDDIDTTNLF